MAITSSRSASSFNTRIRAMMFVHFRSPATWWRRVWLKVAREHGVTRVRLGFDIGQLVREFVILRHVIRDVSVARGCGPEVEAVLADVLDAAIGEAVAAYVEARDLEAQRKQAEH